MLDEVIYKIYIYLSFVFVCTVSMESNRLQDIFPKLKGSNVFYGVRLL